MPRVSVIIPTYNHERFVAQAVESALAQTYTDLEVIVVDDGSTDHTREALIDYDRQITYIYQENLGLSAARNRGISAARGDVFLFLDADDLIPPDKLALQLPALDAQPDLGLVYSGFQYITEDGARVLREIRPNKEGHVLKDLLRRTLFFPPGAALVRRERLEQVGLFEQACPAAADTEMWVRIARAGYAFGYVDRPLFQYRIVPGSMSSNLTNQARDEFIRLEKFFADPNLPAEIKALEAEAHSVVHYEFTAKYYHAGDGERGQAHLCKAISTCPSLSCDEEWLLEWIAGYALGSHAEEPQRVIDAIFDNLLPEAETLRSLRRRAHGRYHTAAAFSAYQARQIKRIRPHILPALWGDPSVILNRGFIRIAVESLFG